MKIGILTHYYKSVNYGGTLQAYALTAWLNNHGYAAEQISYRLDTTAPFGKRIAARLSSLFSFKQWKKKIVAMRARDECAQRSAALQPKFATRVQSILNFGERIPHTEEVYDNKNVATLNGQYDCFVVGSDQVWNFDYFRKAFFLAFVADPDRKVAYGASLGTSAPTRKYIRYLTARLSDFRAISLREQDAQAMLSSVLHRPDVAWVVDPTLLLTPAEWDDVCSPRIVAEPYVFCYFLSPNSAARQAAKQFAADRGLKIVMSPHVRHSYEPLDDGFADEEIYNMGPQDFISLIKYADYVFTDSFHGSVFSLIYKKQFFTYGRSGEEAQNSRLGSLFSLFDCRSRLCDDKDKETVSYIESLADVDYSRQNEAFERLRDASIRFLQAGLSESAYE